MGSSKGVAPIPFVNRRDFREDRLYTKAKLRPSAVKDHREPAQRDRDCIIHCSSFRRLADVTQVSSSPNSVNFHNRLTHSFEVAQIAMRLAQNISMSYPQRLRDLGVTIDADACEAAGFAHDIGHPPFGHIGERVLNRCSLEADRDHGGFEGNAQSFRTVVALSTRSPKYDGLNLTRWTLNAILKHPLSQSEVGAAARDASLEAPPKYGAYDIDKDAFEWARAGLPPKSRTLEAELVDWADEIAYAVYDLHDFYLAGLIPIEKFAGHKKECFTQWQVYLNRLAEVRAPKVLNPEWRTKAMFQKLPFHSWGTQAFDGRLMHRKELRRSVSMAYAAALWSTKLCDEWTSDKGFLCVDDWFEGVVSLLKGLTEVYVLNKGTLVAMQEGHKKVLATVFAELMDAATAYKARPTRTSLLPGSMRESIDSDGTPVVRVVCDAIARMTEHQVYALYRRLSGKEPGHITDPIVY